MIFLQGEPEDGTFLNDISVRLKKSFFRNFWRTSVVFVGPVIPLFWTSGDVCPGFQNQGGSPLLRASSSACNGILRFTFGATPVYVSFVGNGCLTTIHRAKMLFLYNRTEVNFLSNVSFLAQFPLSSQLETISILASVCRMI